MVLPVDHCDSRSVGIPCRLNTEIALVALSSRHHPLIRFRVLGMIHVSIDGRENNCIVGWLGGLRDERHHRIIELAGSSQWLSLALYFTSRTLLRKNRQSVSVPPR